MAFVLLPVLELVLLHPTTFFFFLLHLQTKYFDTGLKGFGAFLKVRLARGERGSEKVRQFVTGESPTARDVTL